MFMWIVFAISYLVILALGDYLVRKKHWRDNSVGEKRSLIIYFLCGIIYLIFSMLGIFMGIAGEPYETGFGELIFNASAYMGLATPLVCLGVVAGSIALRKKNKLSASNHIHLIAIIYILLSLVASFVADAV